MSERLRSNKTDFPPKEVDRLVKEARGLYLALRGKIEAKGVRPEDIDPEDWAHANEAIENIEALAAKYHQEPDEEKKEEIRGKIDVLRIKLAGSITRRLEKRATQKSASLQKESPVEGPFQAEDAAPRILSKEKLEELREHLLQEEKASADDIVDLEVISDEETKLLPHDRSLDDHGPSDKKQRQDALIEQLNPGRTSLPATADLTDTWEEHLAAIRARNRARERGEEVPAWAALEPRPTGADNAPQKTEGIPLVSEERLAGAVATEKGPLAQDDSLKAEEIAPSLAAGVVNGAHEQDPELDARMAGLVAEEHTRNATEGTPKEWRDKLRSLIEGAKGRFGREERFEYGKFDGYLTGRVSELDAKTKESGLENWFRKVGERYNEISLGRKLVLGLSLGVGAGVLSTVSMPAAVACLSLIAAQRVSGLASMFLKYEKSTTEGKWQKEKAMGKAIAYTAGMTLGMLALTEGVKEAVNYGNEHHMSEAIRNWLGQHWPEPAGAPANVSAPEHSSPLLKDIMSSGQVEAAASSQPTAVHEAVSAAPSAAASGVHHGVELAQAAHGSASQADLDATSAQMNSGHAAVPAAEAIPAAAPTVASSLHENIGVPGEGMTFGPEAAQPAAPVETASSAVVDAATPAVAPEQPVMPQDVISRDIGVPGKEFSFGIPDQNPSLGSEGWAPEPPAAPVEAVQPSVEAAATPPVSEAAQAIPASTPEQVVSPSVEHVDTTPPAASSLHENIGQPGESMTFGPETAPTHPAESISSANMPAEQTGPAAEQSVQAAAEHIVVNAHGVPVNEQIVGRYLGADDTHLIFGGDTVNQQQAALQWAQESGKPSYFVEWRKEGLFFSKDVPHLMQASPADTSPVGFLASGGQVEPTISELPADTHIFTKDDLLKAYAQGGE